MNELAKRKKKKGFTLVELIAVMAILAILAAVIAPKAMGYIKKAKQTKVVQQCHTLVLAVDAYNADKPLSSQIKGDTALGTAGAEGNLKTLIDDELITETDVDKINSDVLISECRDIANGTGTIDLDADDKLTKKKN